MSTQRGRLDDAAILEKIGPNAKLSRLLDVDRRDIWNWKIRGIPWHRRAKVAELAYNSGITIPLDFINRGPTPPQPVDKRKGATASARIR